ATIATSVKRTSQYQRDHLPRTGGGSSSAAIGEQVREQPIRAGHARRQLPEEREAGVDERALAEPRDEEAALARRLAAVVHRQRGVVVRIPFACEIEPALLDPSLEVRRGDAIGRAQHGMIHQGHRGALVGDALLRDLEWMWPDVRRRLA